MKKDWPLISVLIVTWDSESFIEKCLRSVLHQTYPTLEVIVIDNRSMDSTARIIREKFPHVTLIENDRNVGYSQANNLGLKRALGDYVLFLNSDVILERDYIEKALKGFQKSDVIGMVSGKILRFDRKTIDSTGQFLARSRRTIERGYGRIDNGRFEQESFIFSVCGAVAFYRRKMIEEISYENGELFDEDFFSFHEDIDVGWRANLMGWKGYYVPEAIAYHFRGSSSLNKGKVGSFQITGRPTIIKYHIIKNRYLSIIKNDRFSSYLLNWPFIAARDLILFFYLLGTSPGVFPLLVKHGNLFRQAYRKRKSIFCRRKKE